MKKLILMAVLTCSLFTMGQGFSSKTEKPLEGALQASNMLVMIINPTNAVAFKLDANTKFICRGKPTITQEDSNTNYYRIHFVTK